MSTYDSDKSTSGSRSNPAAEAVREAFAALPFEQKLTTLLKIELDLVGDVAESIANAASKAFDDFARSCRTSSAQEPPQPVTTDTGL